MNDYQFKNLKESRLHGSFILPFSIYNGTLDDSDPIINIHWHEEIEILIVENGYCDCMINLENYVAEKGDIIIVKPQALHSFSIINHNNLDWSSIVFNLEILKSSSTDGCLIKYLAPILNNEHELPCIIKNNSLGHKEILACLKNILRTFTEKNIAFELELKSQLFHLIALFYKFNLVNKNTSKKELSSNATYKMKTILNFIKEHYAESISITSLAKLINFSEYHFMKFFKKHIGMTAIEYINNYRLEIAANKLTSTNNSIMEISMDVGFSSVSYFNKLFKIKYNLTPKEFRKINDNK